MYIMAEAETSQKKPAARRATRNVGLDIALQDLGDSVEDELLVVDSKYRVRFANSAVRSRLQKGVESPIGGTCYKLFQGRDKPCDVPLWQCPVREVLQSGSATTVIHHERTMGGDRYLKINAYPVRDNYGNISAILELRRDVTVERELETQILRRHHQLLALSHISSAVSGLWDLDAILGIAFDNVLEIINGAIGGILLLDEETETLYYRVHRGLSAKYAEEMRLHLGEGIAGRVAQTGESMWFNDVSKDPLAAHPALLIAEGLKGLVSIPLKAKDKVVGVMNVASPLVGRFGTDDVSLLNSIGHTLGTAIERARLYERLTEAGERYQTLLRNALTAQEDERKRIARELHDETSQALTSLSLSLQAIIQMAEMKGIEDEEFMGRLKKTQSYAVHAHHEIVRLMRELRPTLLDELGLPAAINRYAKDVLEPQGINVSTEFRGTDERLPLEVEVTLFRVVQGAIGNVLEHSAAKNASVKLECNANEYLLYIEDDGKGFDVSKLTRVDPSGRGAGLFTMKERVKLVGGSCRIDSQPGHGTKLIIKIPVTRELGNEKHKSAPRR